MVVLSLRGGGTRRDGEESVVFRKVQGGVCASLTGNSPPALAIMVNSVLKEGTKAKKTENPTIPAKKHRARDRNARERCLQATFWNSGSLGTRCVQEGEGVEAVVIAHSRQHIKAFRLAEGVLPPKRSTLSGHSPSPQRISHCKLKFPVEAKSLTPACRSNKRPDYHHLLSHKPYLLATRVRCAVGEM